MQLKLKMMVLWNRVSIPEPMGPLFLMRYYGGTAGETQPL